MESYILGDRLRQAIDRADLAEVTSLIDKGADIDAKDKHGLTPLHWAVNCNAPRIVELLIARGCDINARNETMDMTPLCLAAYNGSTAMASLLLARGALADIGDAGGDTPYDIALSMQHQDMVALLAEIRPTPAIATTPEQAWREPMLQSVSVK